jgi:hypothetical protein
MLDTRRHIAWPAINSHYGADTRNNQPHTIHRIIPHMPVTDVLVTTYAQETYVSVANTIDQGGQSTDSPQKIQ